MKNIVQSFVILAIVALLGQTIILYTVVNDTTPIRTQGYYAVTGEANICVVQPFTANLTGCPTSAGQSTTRVDNSYTCNASISTSSNTSVNMTIIYDDLGGSLNINKTSENSFLVNATHFAVGNQTAYLTFSTGNTNCTQNKTIQYEFEIMEVNDPPIQTQLLPSQNLERGTAIRAFFLTDYFNDYEDGTNLSWSVTGTENFEVLLDNQGQVVISNPEDNCDQDEVYFTATDKGNLSTDSNMVVIKSNCEEPAEDGSSDSSGSGGGGGGGGIPPEPCEPKWECDDWGECQPDGNRSRVCKDKNACDPNRLTQTFYESCNYIAHCFDGVQNYDEEGVDCGGEDCEECIEATCTDGVQNQGEEGVDCGGPCDNACEIAPTCDDGLQNQGETGIDCGGPCGPCQDINVPQPVEESNFALYAALITGLTITVAGLAFFVFKKQIKSWLARLSWFLTRRQRKQIIINQDAKTYLLEEIDETLEEYQEADTRLHPTSKLIQITLNLAMYYVTTALNITEGYTEDDVEEALHDKVSNASLRSAIKSFAEETQENLQRDESFEVHEAKRILQETRQLVLNTSETTQDDYNFDVTIESVPDNPYDKADILLENAMLSMQFNEINACKKRYLDLLDTYEELSEAKQSNVDRALNRLNNYIRYSLSWSKQQV